ncbi:MAG: hypothetical protein ACLVD2_13860 [Blautia sp.]
MINVSSQFLETMELRQDFRENAEITFLDGNKLVLGEKDFTLTNNGIADGAGANALPLGTAMSRTVQIELMNDKGQYEKYNFLGAKIRLYLTFPLLDGTTEKIEYGIYTVVTPEIYGTTVIVTASDDMYKTDMAYTTSLPFPATIKSMLRDCCTACKISLHTSDIPNGDFIVQEKPSGEYTHRQIIGYIAMIAGGNARINQRGSLEIKAYQFDYAASFHKLKKWKNLTIGASDITITGIQTNIRDKEGNETTILEGEEGYVLKIKNPLISGKEQQALSLIGEKLLHVSFRKFSGDHISYPLAEFMDLAEITDWRGNTYRTFITDIDFTFLGFTSIKNSAADGIRNAGKYSSNQTDTLIQAQQMVEEERTAREQAVEKLANALATSSGLYMSVEKQPDGSSIFYMHDKPVLKESKVVWKLTAEAFGISLDGGKTYPYGFTVTGEMIMKILHTEGINADWINTGAITVRDSSENVIFSVDMDTKKVFISGDFVQIGGKPAPDALDSLLSESKGYSDKKLADYANTVTKDMENLKAQVDGQVEDWYFDYEPSMQNKPASEWTTADERKKHIGDRFFWKSKGYAYRFMENNGVWGWTLLQDTDITKAMQAAQDAKDVADGKRRTFVTTPKPPYDIGDLWTNGADILTCTVARASGSAYVSTDWEKLNEYTDDTVANQALEEAKKAHNILIQLDNEYQGIPADYKGNISVFPEVKTQVYVFFGHQDVSAQCTYTVQKSASVSGTWDNTRRVYTVTGLSADTGWVDITASYLGVLYATKRFTVSKVKGGTPGPQGEDGTVSRNYMLESSDAVIKKGADNRLSPATITFKAFYRDGNAASRTAYAGRFKIEESTNGTSFVAKYTSVANESVKSYTPSSAEVRIIRCTLYAAGGTTNSLDTQTVVVLTDVSNLEVGSDNLVNKDDVQGLYGTVVKRNGYTYDISGTSHKEDGNYRGVFIPETIFTVGESYVFSYKFTVKSGSVTKIGGHQAAFTTIKAVIDGTEYKTEYDAGYPLDSKKTEHTVAVYLKYHGVGDDKKLYIQPNRQGGTNGAWNILLTEVQVRKGNTKTDWQPSLKDSLGSIQVGGRNLLRNSTFNEGLKYWVARSEYATVVRVGRNGENCLKQIGKLRTDSTITHSTVFSVKTGESYALSGWAKGANIVKGTTNYFVSIYASFYGADDEWKAQESILSGDMPLTDDWERKVLIFQVPNVTGITRMRISIYARDFTGTIWWDDVQLEKANKVSDWSPALEDMETLVITLSNEAHTVTTDKNGNGGNFADCETTVQVYNGTQDVTAQTTYTVTKSSGVTGVWDSTNHKYKVTALSTDDGYVDIKAVYNGISVVKRFTISKSKTGATGATGADGKTSYFHIKYAPVQNPTASQMTETPNVFIGTYVDFTPADSTDPQKYTWYRFQGLQGPEGNQGIPGKNGANGQTSYLHIKYSNDGGKTFTTNTGETPGDYIGQYVDFVQADSTDPKRYSWSKTKGETGRTYFIELSANILKRKQNNRILPISVSAKAFYRDGTSAARTAYAGRWKVETSTNGVDYTTVASSTVDESSKSYRVETLAANIVSVRFTLYAAGGFTTPLDMQSIPIVIDVDNLTHEQIFNLLTNNGAMKGIYQSGGQLYINGTYIRSLILTADMIQGKELASLGATLGGFIVESKRIRNTSSDGKKAMYMGSYDWNNSDFLVVQNNASGSWKNLLMLKYDGSLESRDSAQTALAQLNAGSLQFKSKDAGSWVSDMAFTSDGLSRGNRCKISVKAPHQNDLSDGSSPGWSENILGDTHIDGTLRVHQLRVTGGSKQIAKQTEHYGEVSFYCDETPTPLLSDYGEGAIASDGLCYVDIDDIFREAVNSNIQYFVFLQKEGPGDCWIRERANTHFVVQGTPGLSFTWAIKVKQKGAEHLRFCGEEQNLRIHSVSPETVMEAEQLEVTQQENETMEQYTNWMFWIMKEMEERYNEEIDIIYES